LRRCKRVDTIPSDTENAARDAPQHPAALLRRCISMSSNRSVDPTTLAGDPIAHAAQIKAQEELYRAAVVAMRLLQDRQQHTLEEQLDSRERKVLQQLRDAVRASVAA
jgi:hypothetical protein